MEESVDIQAPEEAVSEKMLPVSRVNEIVKREKLEAAERARAEMEAEYQRKLGAMQPHAQANPPQMQSGVGGMQAVDMDSITRQVREQLMAEHKREQEEVQRKQHQQQMEQIADSFFNKLSSGKEMYPDFEEVVKGFNPAAFPQLVFLAAEMENTPDVIYELAKNPHKLATIDYLAQRDPNAAKMQLAKLSDSIAQNQQAVAQAKNANAPLSRLKSSTVGADTGVMSLSDLKKAPWLRG